MHDEVVEWCPITVFDDQDTADVGVITQRTGDVMRITGETKAPCCFQAFILLLHRVAGRRIGAVRIAAEEFSYEADMAVLVLIEIDIF